MENKIKHLREELQEERDKYQGKVSRKLQFYSFLVR